MTTGLMAMPDVGAHSEAPASPTLQQPRRKDKKDIDAETLKIKSIKTPLSQMEDLQKHIIDVDVFVGRSLEKRREEAQGGKVPRPLNSFIMYRKAYNSMALEYLGGKDGGKQDKVSVLVGASWAIETKAIKDRFKMLAAIDSERHNAAHGKHKYRPERKKKKDGESTGRVKAGRIEKSRATPRLRQREILTPEPTPESSFSVLSTPPRNPYFFEGSPAALAYPQPTPATSLTATPEPQIVYTNFQQVPYANPYQNSWLVATPSSNYPHIRTPTSKEAFNGHLHPQAPQSPTFAYSTGFPPQQFGLAQPEIYDNSMWQLPELPQPERPSPIQPVPAPNFDSMTRLSMEGSNLIDPQLLNPSEGPGFLERGCSSPLPPAEDLLDADAYLKTQWEDDTDALTLFEF